MALPVRSIKDPPDDTPLEIGPLSAPFELRARESVRGMLAIVLTCAIIALMFLSLVGVFLEPTRAAAVKEIISIFITPFIGVYGTVLGFYFSQNK